MTAEPVQANPLNMTLESLALSETPNLLRGYAAQTLTVRLERMLSHADNVLAEDMEALKQMRVWSRRSRAALDIFGVCFAEQPFSTLANEVKNVTRALGTARDLDVMISKLEAMQEGLSEEQQSGIQFGIDHLQKQRKSAQPAVVEAIEHLKRFDLANRWKALQVLPAKPAPKSKKLAKKISPLRLACQESPLKNGARAVQVRCDELLAHESCLTDSKRVLEHHEMRIAAKRLRYTLEIFKDAFMDDAYAPTLSTLTKHIRDLQEFLGDIHDADVLVPQLISPLMQLLQQGYNYPHIEEFPVGVDRVDFHGLAGLIAACQATRSVREQCFIDLQARWQTLRDLEIFEQTTALLGLIVQGGD